MWEKTKRIWEPAGEGEYEDMGDWEGSFKLAVPVEAARMTASTSCTRDSRVVWKLELVFDHKPIPYVGTRIVRTSLLNIKSYTSPPISPPTPCPAIIVPGASIHVRPPVGAFGPGDTFRVEFDVVPDDIETSVRKGQVTLDRRSEPLAIPPDLSLAMPIPARQTLEVRKHARPREKRSFFRRSRSTSADTSPSPVSPYEKLEDDIPSPPPTASPPSVTRSTVLEINTPDPTVSSSGFSFVATGTIPPRAHKWDAGETGRTRLLATSFELRIRFALKTKKSPSKEITCPQFPIILVGANTEERAAAGAALAKATAEEKAKAGLPAKKRHRSSRRGLYMQEGTIEISDPVVAPHGTERDSTRRASPLPETPPVVVGVSTGKGILVRNDDLPEAGPSRPRTSVKPILLRSDHESPPIMSSSGQGISFALPSRSTAPASVIPTPSRTVAAAATMLTPPISMEASPVPSPTRTGGLNITELIHPIFNEQSPFSPKPTDVHHPYLPRANLPTLNRSSAPHGPVPLMGRRISTTMSEDEDIQPSRSRQRLDCPVHSALPGEPPGYVHGIWCGIDRPEMTITPATTVLPPTPVLPPQPAPDTGIARPSLPSLDALGLGLPKVPEYDRTPRPRTAPTVSIFPHSAWNNVRQASEQDVPRPVTSAGLGFLGAGGSSVDVTLGPGATATAQDRRARIYAQPTAASSVTSFGSTRPLLATAATEADFRGRSHGSTRLPTSNLGTSAFPISPLSTHNTHISGIRQSPASTSQKTMTIVVPVLDQNHEDGYRVGAGSFAPTISQQQQLAEAQAAAAEPQRRRSSVFGLGGRSFGRTEEGSFAFGLKG